MKREVNRFLNWPQTTRIGARHYVATVLVES